MPAPRKYPPELRERATRMTVEARRDAATRDGAIARTADRLGINRETLRNWVAQAEVDAGHRPGTTTDQAQRLAELERENRELKRANAIMKSASAFFRPVVFRAPQGRLTPKGRVLVHTRVGNINTVVTQEPTAVAPVPQVGALPTTAAAPGSGRLTPVPERRCALPVVAAEAERVRGAVGGAKSAGPAPVRAHSPTAG